MASLQVGMGVMNLIGSSLIFQIEGHAAERSWMCENQGSGIAGLGDVVKEHVAGSKALSGFNVGSRVGFVGFLWFNLGLHSTGDSVWN